MAEHEYITIKRPSDNNELFYDVPFTKWQAWIDLIFLALPEDKDFLIRGILVHGKKGCAYVSRRKLAERWGWSDKKVVRFLQYLSTTPLVTPPTTPVCNSVSTCVSIANYDSYFRHDPTNNPTSDPTKVKKQKIKEGTTPLVTPPMTPVVNSVSTCVSNDKENDKITTTPPITPLATPQKKNTTKEEKEERKETKKKKSPTPPIKEINKEKKEPKKENGSNAGAHIRTCTHEEESTFSLTPETSTEKKPTKKKSEEEYTVTYKARLIFDKIYTEKNDDKYYWAPKEIKALTDLLKKIKFSREHRKVPLPVDDDSLLTAFEEFINKIQTIWVLEHYTMANINAQYQVIIQDIKNNRNGKSNYQTTAERNRLNSERQKEAIRANVRKLDESRERWLKERKRESSGVEGQVSSDDPLGFL